MLFLLACFQLTSKTSYCTMRNKVWFYLKFLDNKSFRKDPITLFLYHIDGRRQLLWYIGNMFPGLYKNVNKTLRGWKENVRQLSHPEMYMEILTYVRRWFFSIRFSAGDNSSWYISLHKGKYVGLSLSWEIYVKKKKIK